jgi:hypothetical protein
MKVFDEEVLIDEALPQVAWQELHCHAGRIGSSAGTMERARGSIPTIFFS